MADGWVLTIWNVVQFDIVQLGCETLSINSKVRNYWTTKM